MDRNEAVLRELNLYLQWVRRSQPVPVETEAHTSVAAEIEPVALPATVEVSSPLAYSAFAGGVGGEQISALNGCETQQPAMGIAEIGPSSTSYTNPSSWAAFKAQVEGCTACKLRAGCTQAIPGAGDEKPDWLFVGEWPDAEEDAQGEPFLGQMGELFDNMLRSIKLSRGKNVHLTHVVKCRPPGDRAPGADEIAACLPHLKNQIELARPKLIIVFGDAAASALIGREAVLDSIRGTLHDYLGIPLLFTYSPAYLLRSPAEKAGAWKDLCLMTEFFAGLKTGTATKIDK